MSRYHHVEVQVDIDDFPSEVILEAAARVGDAGRSSLLGGGPETPHETLSRIVERLAACIAGGNTAESLRCLDDLVGDNRCLRDAIDIGRRRVQ